MKNLIVILIILTLIFSSFKRSYPVRWPSSLKEINNPSILTITRNTLRCVSSLHHKDEQWTKLHVKSLKKGVNKFGFVATEGQRIELIITNY